MAVPDGQRQEDGPMGGEVLVELRQPFKEAPPPCPASAPLAEGAEAAVAGVSRPKERFARGRPINGDLHADRCGAVPNGFCQVQCLGIHCQVVADG